MKKTHTTRILAAAVLSLLSFTANKSQALPVSSWTLSGTAPAGGANIIGSATNVGQLDASTSPDTSATGNYVTLNLGSTAYGSESATVQFTTDNNTLLNNGIINAPNNDPSITIPFENTGVAYYSDGINTGNTLINNNTINGGFGDNTDTNFGSEGGFIILDAGVGFYGFNGVVNTTVTNGVNGIINGGNGDGYSSDADGNNPYAISVGDGIIIFDRNGAGDNINGVNFTNSGKVTAGNNSNEAISVDNGFAVIGFGDVKNITINNTSTGIITGGSMESGSKTPDGFFSGNGVVVAAGVPPFFVTGLTDPSTGDHNLDTVNFTNAGLITGGNNNRNNDNILNPSGNAAGNGVIFWGVNGVYNIKFNNTSTGSLIGGDENDGYGFGNRGFNEGSGAGNGVAIFDANDSLSNPRDIIGVDATNAGIITGGNNNRNAFLAGTGFGIVGLGDVDSVMFHNTDTGAITGGNGNSNALFSGNGVTIASINNSNSCSSDVTFTNDGNIRGGNNNSSFTGISGAGLVFYNGSSSGVGRFTNTPGMLNNIHVINNGNIYGGNNNQNVLSMGSAFFGVSGAGVVFYTSPGQPTEKFTSQVVSGETGMNHILLENEGNIIGGNGGTGGILPKLKIQSNASIGSTNGGNGVHIFAGGESSDIVISNCGTIKGGDAGTVLVSADNAIISEIAPKIPITPQAGMGIYSVASGVTIYNWGVIASGNGGTIPTAIYLDGNNNTINLNGHSSVFGKITAEGTNNVLNINFTGMNPASIAALNAQLAAQGYPSNNFTGTFTVRGVTYVIDPLKVNVNVTSYEQFALTPNQLAVAQSLDSLTTNPAVGSPLMNLFNAIDGGCGARTPTGINPQALEAIFNALSPSGYFALGAAGIAQMDFLTLEMDTRLNNIRDGSESIDTMGVTVADISMADMSKESPGKESKAFVPSSKQMKWGFFARGETAFGRETAHDGVPDSRFTNSGIVLGADAKITDNLVAGLLFNYSHTNATTDNVGSTARTDTYGGGLYGSFTGDRGFYANGLFTYAHNSYETSRNIFFPGFGSVASGRTNGNQYGINMDGGYDYHVNEHLTISPTLGLQYVNLGIDGFNEIGAGAASLAIGNQNVDSLRSRLGFRVDWHKKIASEVAFAAELRAAWQHEFLNDSQTISSLFIGSGLSPFSVRSPNPERDAALVGVGINATMRNNMTIFVDYDAQCGQQHYFEYTVRGGLRFSF